MSEIIHLSFPDQTTSQIEVFGKIDSSNQAIVILMPAMAISSKYYKAFAEYLANQLNIISITSDLRGLGKSSVRVSKKVDFGYQNLLEDYTLIIQTLQQKYPNQPIYLLGHSLGGQIASLLATHKTLNIKGLILIACASNYYKQWSGLNRLTFGGFLRVARWTARVLGYFPGKKMGFGGTEAKTLIQDWSYMGLFGKYKIKNSSIDYEKNLATTRLPILAMGIQNDYFAPPKAIHFLLKKFAQSPDIQQITVSSAEHKLNHINWLKYPELFGKSIRVFLNN
jgi:predicted alpha/beta hydrolase